MVIIRNFQRLALFRYYRSWSIRFKLVVLALDLSALKASKHHKHQSPNVPAIYIKKSRLVEIRATSRSSMESDD